MEGLHDERDKVLMKSLTPPPKSAHRVIKSEGPSTRHFSDEVNCKPDAQGAGDGVEVLKADVGEVCGDYLSDIRDVRMTAALTHH